MDLSESTRSLKAEAKRLGFELVQACAAVEPAGWSQLNQWLDHGYSGDMDWFKRYRDAYRHPDHVLPQVRSLLMLGMRYQGRPHATERTGAGRLAGYAAAPTDYHDLIRERLNRLGEALESLIPNASWRGVVDTAPLLEREFAALAGLGWQAKNTMLISPTQGSYFFLAALLTDGVLQPDAPIVTDHCGTCRRCLDACPTDAFVAPRVLDARRCISYLTIELRTAIPVEFRPSMQDWVFGCDVCQDVCPWNRFAQPPANPEFDQPDSATYLDLVELLDLDDEGFRQRFRKTPLWRARRRGVLRNAAIVMGNQALPEYLEPLRKALTDAEPLVRGAAAWALGRLSHPNARQALVDQLSEEADAEVRQEIEQAIASWPSRDKPC